MIIKKNNLNKREVKKAQEHFIAPVQNVLQNDESSDNSTAQEIEISKEPELQEPEIDLFDIENIDFNQRQERRRGTRRRGYRRIDDRNLVSRAQDEAENIKKSAFEEGYRQGLEQANSDIENFRLAIKEFLGAPKEVFEYISPDILEISVDIAKRIIKKEVQSDPQIIINTIVDVLKTASKNEPKVNIRVSPKVVTFVKDVLPNTMYENGIDTKVNIISDPSIEEGGCVFQTNNGIVDASIDTQIEIIKKALEGI